MSSLATSEDQKLTRAGMFELHNESIDFLEKSISISASASSDKKCIIVTHFPPTRRGTCAPKYEYSIYRDYFANELSELDKTPIDLWISGHTHYSYDFIRNGVRYYANQIGYPNELDESCTDKVAII